MYCGDASLAWAGIYNGYLEIGKSNDDWYSGEAEIL